MKSTDQGFVKSCASKVAEIPRENWDMVGATVIRAMSARLTEVNASIKKAERELYDVCFQVVVEGESLRQTELEALKGAYENLTETIERLK